MKLHSIKIFWFWNYTKEIFVDFSLLEKEKKYCLVTWKNGVGKSMLFELVVNCLTWTGRVNNLKDLVPSEIYESWRTSFVTLKLDDWKGNFYVIEKSVSKKDWNYIEFYKERNDGSIFEIAKGNKESKKAIEEFVQINSTTIYDSIYSSQGELMSFFEKTPEEARKTIMNILGVEDYLVKSKTSFSIGRSLEARIKEIEKIIENEEVVEEKFEDLLKEKEKIENEIETIKKQWDEEKMRRKSLKEFQEKYITHKENFIKRDLHQHSNEVHLKEYEKNWTLEEKKKKQEELKEKIIEIQNLKRELVSSENSSLRIENEIKENKEKIKGKKEIKWDLEKLESELDELQTKEFENNAQIKTLKNSLTNSEDYFSKKKISTLEKEKEKVNEELEQFRFSYMTISEKYNKNLSLIKEGKFVICPCCNSVVSEENKEHFENFLKTHKIKSSSEDISVIKEENKKLLTEIEEKKKIGLETKELLKKIESSIKAKEEVEIKKEIEILISKSEKEKIESLKEKISQIKDYEKVKIIKENIKKREEELETFNQKIKGIKTLIKSLGDEEKIIEERTKLGEVIVTMEDLKSEIEKQKQIETIENFFIDSFNSSFKKKFKKSLEISLFIEKELSTQFIEKDVGDLKISLQEVNKKILIIEKIEKENKKIDFLRKEKMYYDWIGEIYDFISKDVYKKSLPIIKNIVNKKLTVSSKGKYQFFIETKKEWKEVFIPKIYNINETEEQARAVKTLSGWEATWVAVALREAFALLASKRSGFSWDFGIFDETFWNQDQEHLDLLVSSILENSFLEQVFLVTHDEQAKEKIREMCGQEIYIGRDEEGSSKVEILIH